MEFCVLGLLMLQEMSLYQLNKAFAQNLSLFYQASLGSLHAVVKQLLARGAISPSSTQSSGRRRVMYAISDAGRQAFFASFGEAIPPGRREETILARLYFLGLIEDGEVRKAVLEGFLTEVENGLSQLGGLADELDTQYPPGKLNELMNPLQARVYRYQRATLAYGLRSHEAAKAVFAELIDKAKQQD